MMILSLYCRNISLFSKHTPYVTIKAISLLFLENDNPLYFYCSLKREKIIFWPLPLIPSKDYCIHSFWSQNTEKRNNTISQMRLRSVYKMRTSILYTATTEQMGYGIISFFVCFPLMNQIVIHPSIYRFPPQYSLRQIVFHRYLHNPSMPGKHIFHHTK